MRAMSAAVIALASALANAAPARADVCRPTVQLGGDAALISQLAAELAGRGIATDGTCPAIAVRVERDGDALVVSIADASRTVHALRTAAAVIESFVREDVALPLLAIHPLAIAGPVRIARPTRSGELRPPTSPRGWHFFGGLEASVASDRTRWMGMQLGACVMIGPLCPAIRLRGSAVQNEDGEWSIAQRKSGELMAGLDVPFRIGRFLLIPGVAVGFGDVNTETGAAPSRSNNLRAQAHVSFSIPLTGSLALDLNAAGTLAQQLAREPGYMTTIDEPYGYLRFGLAMRYGDR